MQACNPASVEPMDLTEARSRLAIVLRDFEKPEKLPDLYRGFEHESVDEPQFPVPDLIFLGLAHLADFPWTGKGEKVRWTVYFAFQGRPFAVQSAKFGYRLRYQSGMSLEQRNSLKRKLTSVVTITERCLESLAELQIAKGNVSIANNFDYMTFAYEHLRHLASNAYVEPVRTHGTPEEAMQSAFDLTHQLKEGSALAGAMIDAYFSRLEHFLILCVPFTNVAVADGALRDLVGANWSVKFTRVFDVQNDRQAKQHYDALNNLKERIRNVLSHGGFEKQDGSFYFHVPEFGPVPAQMTRSKGALKFSVFAAPIPKDTFAECCRVFDAADKFFFEGPTAMASRWIKNGLNVAYDAENIAKYNAAMSSAENFNEYLNHQIQLADRAANMDW